MRDQAAADPGLLTRIMARSNRWLPVAFLLVALLLASLAWALRGYVSPAKVAGYPGVFFLSFVGAVSMVLPVPAMITVCTLSTTLDPFLLGSLYGLGEWLGEWSGYVVGYAGVTLFERFSIYRNLRPRVGRWMEKRGSLLVFLASAIPNPAFDVVGIAAGAVQFPFARFMTIVFIGKIVKGLLVTYTCHYGISLWWG